MPPVAAPTPHVLLQRRSSGGRGRAGPRSSPASLDTSQLSMTSSVASSERSSLPRHRQAANGAARRPDWRMGSPYDQITPPVGGRYLEPESQLSASSAQALEGQFEAAADMQTALHSRAPDGILVSRAAPSPCLKPSEQSSAPQRSALRAPSIPAAYSPAPMSVPITPAPKKDEKQPPIAPPGGRRPLPIERSLLQEQLRDEERQHLMLRESLAAAQQLLTNEREARAAAEARAASISSACSEMSSAATSAEEALARTTTEGEHLKQALFEQRLKTLTAERVQAEKVEALRSCEAAASEICTLETQIGSLKGELKEVEGRSSDLVVRMSTLSRENSEARRLLVGAQDGVEIAVSHRLGQMMTARSAKGLKRRTFKAWRGAVRELEGESQQVAVAPAVPLVASSAALLAASSAATIAFAPAPTDRVSTPSDIMQPAVSPTRQPVSAAHSPETTTLLHPTEATAEASDWTSGPTASIAVELAATPVVDAAAESPASAARPSAAVAAEVEESSRVKSSGVESSLGKQVAVVGFEEMTALRQLSSGPMTASSKRSAERSVVQVSEQAAERAAPRQSMQKVRARTALQLVTWMIVALAILASHTLWQPLPARKSAAPGAERDVQLASAEGAPLTSAFSLLAERFSSTARPVTEGISAMVSMWTQAAPPPSPEPQTAAQKKAELKAAFLARKHEAQAAVKRRRKGKGAETAEAVAKAMPAPPPSPFTALASAAEANLPTLPLPALQVFVAVVSWLAAASWLRRSGWQYPLLCGALVALGMQEIVDLATSAVL